MEAINIIEAFVNAARSRNIVKLIQHDGRERIAEPYGIFANDSEDTDVKFCTFQLSGHSGSGGLPDWRNPFIHDFKDIKVLPEKFSIQPSYRPGNKKVYPFWIFRI